MDNLSTNPNSGVTIPAGQNYLYFRVVGSAAGTDTMTASVTSPVHTPATVYTVVGQGRTDPIGSWPSTLAVGDSVLVTMTTRDPNGTGRAGARRAHPGRRRSCVVREPT